jgi:hypothetical protein
MLLGNRRSAKRRNLPLSISLHCRMCVSHLLSMKSFHEVLAGNVSECLLKSGIGKARIVGEHRHQHSAPGGYRPHHDEKPHPPHGCNARNACPHPESPRRPALVAINRWSAPTRQRSGAATPRDLAAASNQTPRHMPARIMSRMKARAQEISDDEAPGRAGERVVGHDPGRDDGERAGA